MKKYDKINRNKQQQQNRARKIESQTAIYSRPDTYKIFTTIHLCSAPVAFEFSLPYNYILHGTDGLSPLEVSYLSRCSDLLLLTVSSHEINQELMSLVKRYMPTAIIVYDRRNKGVARSVAKLFGDIRICEVSMLGGFLAKFQTANTNLCSTRPFMVAREAVADGEYLYLEGFMKNGLRSDKIIINGVYEGIIEEVAYGDEVVCGADLNVEEDERLLVREKAEDVEPEEADGDYGESDEADDSCRESEEDYDEVDLDEPLDEAMDPEYDLIERYKEYRGIMNLATCTFKDQERPEYYKDIIFIKNIKYAQNILKTKRSAIPPNTFLRLKVRVFQAISQKLVILFNLYEFETRNTIFNYEFVCRDSIGKDVTIDNGYRIFNTRTILTRNLKNNVFQEESTLDHGIVSFIGPFSFYSTTAYIVNGDSAVKLLNGESKDRIFFDCVELKGRPIKIFKRYCVIRGMFYSKEQVDYFSNLRVEAKNGNKGFIKRALGTKGLFKAYFSHPIKHDETITMSLYKRVFL